MVLLLLVVIVKILACCLATNCPDGWLAFEGSCYLFGTDDIYFTEAEHFCRQHNAHLVHVGSSDENNFLKGYINAYFAGTHDYWLGMTDEIAEGLWRWTDDNGRLEFNDWGPTEPQNAGGHEDCAVMHHGAYLWADIGCASGRRALCELSGETAPFVVG